MNTGKDALQRRILVLRLAEELGNVAEACRRAGVTRTQYYEYKRRFDQHGVEGLKNLPRAARSHPQATPLDLVDKIATLALAMPTAGCNRLEAELKSQGIRLSSVSIQKHLVRRSLGSRHDRWLALERIAVEQGRTLDAAQTAFIEKHNPCFGERHAPCSRPGELLTQSTRLVGRFEGAGKLYLHSVVDTFGNHAFAALHVSKRPEAAVALLHDAVLPFYERHGLALDAILTDNGREFRGSATHPYELYLLLNGIEHRRARVGSRKASGFAERFQRTAVDEFFSVESKRKGEMSLSSLQEGLAAWLAHYNGERVHPGYPNHGRTPRSMVLGAMEETADGLSSMEIRKQA